MNVIPELADCAFDEDGFEDLNFEDAYIILGQWDSKNQKVRFRDQNDMLIVSHIYRSSREGNNKIQTEPTSTGFFGPVCESDGRLGA